MLLDAFSWQLPDPGVYLVQGPNGSGKSLLARLITGRLRPQRGDVRLDGSSLYPRLRVYADPVWLSIAGTLEPDDEPLYDYLESELWRADASMGALAPYWEVLEGAIPGARQRSLGSLSSGELALAQVALGAAAPTRLAVLDGQLGLLDARLLGYAARLLRLTGGQQDRFVVATALSLAGELPAAHARYRLGEGLPLRIEREGEAEL
jgi:ABC-type transport system involved in cytochrome c biogenesis ATPase subunit